jgi:hypothetical protein
MGSNVPELAVVAELELVRLQLPEQGNNISDVGSRPLLQAGGNPGILFHNKLHVCRDHRRICRVRGPSHVHDLSVRKL